MKGIGIAILLVLAVLFCGMSARKAKTGMDARAVAAITDLRAAYNARDAVTREAVSRLTAAQAKLAGELIQIQKDSAEATIAALKAADKEIAKARAEMTGELAQLPKTEATKTEEALVSVAALPPMPVEKEAKPVVVAAPVAPVAQTNQPAKAVAPAPAKAEAKG